MPPMCHFVHSPELVQVQLFCRRRPSRVPVCRNVVLVQMLCEREDPGHRSECTDMSVWHTEPCPKQLPVERVEPGLGTAAAPRHAPATRVCRHRAEEVVRSDVGNADDVGDVVDNDGLSELLLNAHRPFRH